MALVARIAVLPNGSDRWIANLSQKGMKIRHNGQWIPLTRNNTKLARITNGQLSWLPVI